MNRTKGENHISTEKKCRRAVLLTNKMTEPSSQLDLGLDKRVSVMLKGDEEYFLHLDG